MELSSVPQSVVHDKCTLYAIAAIFKFERRDVRFYTGGPSSLLKIPSPPRSVVSSAANSAGNSPPKVDDAGESRTANDDELTRNLSPEA